MTGTMGEPSPFALPSLLRSAGEAVAASMTSRRPTEADGEDGETDATLVALLSAMADVLETGAPSARAELQRRARDHGLDRLARGFDMRGLLGELFRARPALLEVGGSLPGPAPSPDELKRLDDGLEIAVTEAAAAYSQARRRVLEALERIAESALGTQRLDDFLQQLLDIVLAHAEGADTASVLLREGEVLRVRAAVGLEEEVHRGITIPVGSGFAGSVARERRPAFLSSAHADPKVLSPVLRASRVEALYGVPLMHEDQLLGVAQVGSVMSRELPEETKLLLRAAAGRAAVAIAQVRLREQERAARTRLLALIETLPVGVAVADETGRITETNTALARVWGGLRHVELPEYAVYRGWRADTGELVSSEDWALARAVRKGETSVGEVLDIERFDGTRGTILNSASPVRDDVGRIIGGVAVVQDITELRAREQRQRLLADASALHASALDVNEVLHRLAELVVPRVADWCAIDVLDEDGEPRRAVVVHPDPEKVALAEELRQRYPPRPDAAHGVARVLRTGRAELLAEISDEILAASVENPELVGVLRGLGLRSSVVAPLVARGEVLGALTLVASESGRRYGPEDLVLAEELGRRAGVALDNARLLRQRERAVELRDEVLAVVSHDLKNPLGAILLSAERLQRARELDDLARLVPTITKRIRSSAERMGRLINELLDLARLRSGHIELREAPTRPGDLLVEVAEALRPLAEEREVDLQVAASTPTSVRCDRDRVLQVLSNLVGNALEATPPGGRVTLRADDRETDVIFSVADTGRGIAKEELPHVFERFTRGSHSGYAGAGLGLAISRALVERHGGSIWADSEVGRGSTFFFTLPLAAPPDQR